MSAVANCTIKGMCGPRLVILSDTSLCKLSILIAATQTFAQVKVLLVKNRDCMPKGEIKLQFALLQY